ncbi:MAG: FecR domain-containing protein, partial [Leptospiraceae bacterium]|nr:FecR domain-containing protein [Leptospiraceae bacterium]
SSQTSESSETGDRGSTGSVEKKLSPEQKDELEKKIKWAKAHREKKDTDLWHDKEGNSSPPKEIGKVHLAIGNVTGSISSSQTRKLKRGMPIYEGEIIKTAAKAVCDLGVNYPDAPGTVIRIRANSTLKVSQSGSKKSSGGPLLSKGKALFNMGKVKKDSNFNVETPTWIAGVRGTQFEIDAKDEKEQKISVAEGKVVTSANIPELELLENEGEMEKQLHSKDIEIEAGKTTNFSQEDNYAFLDKSGLTPILKESDKPEFETKLNNHAKSEGFLSSFGNFLAGAQKSLQEMLGKDLEKSLAQFNEMVTLKDSKFSDMIKASDRIELHNANQKDLDKLIDNDKITCGESRIPMAFLTSCSESHVQLKFPNRDAQDAYQYYNLTMDNYNARVYAYKYFYKNCDTKLKAVSEKLNSRLKTDIDKEERFSVRSAILKLSSCGK